MLAVWCCSTWHARAAAGRASGGGRTSVAPVAAFAYPEPVRFNPRPAQCSLRTPMTIEWDEWAAEF